MKNENSSRWTGRWNPSANGRARQASPAKSLRNTWRLPATAEYLSAVREADQAVFKAIMGGMLTRHTARPVKSR